jgi:glycosyl hydrolase family 2
MSDDGLQRGILTPLVGTSIARRPEWADRCPSIAPPNGLRELHARPLADRQGCPRVSGRAFACGAERVSLQGVAYGPFPPDQHGQPFPDPQRMADDFGRMRSASINAIRTYHVPPETLLELAEQQGLWVLVDVPERPDNSSGLQPRSSWVTRG